MSDTALWVASCRAQEGQRADAAFTDPLAPLLAGERGHAIARSFSRATMVQWGIIIRTCAIDRLINEALAAGVDTVLNLGAGLDTRPYRMQLPADLRWIEMDFPAIVNLKNAKLADYRPACALERIGIDLLDPSRSNLFARCMANSTRALVICEGVIPYWSIHDVAALASELHAIAPIHYWIQDFEDASQRTLPRGWEAKLQAAPRLFAVKDWFEFFASYGWRPIQVITSLQESERLKRPYPFDLPFGLLLRALPKGMRQKILSLSGALMMQRAHGKADGRSSAQRTPIE